MSELTDQLAQIHDSAAEIARLVDTGLAADPSVLYLEALAPDGKPEYFSTRLKPQLYLGCREHPQFGMYFPAGDKVSAAAVFSQARSHLDAEHLS